MTREEARIVVLTYSLDQALNSIEFMQGCLTDPDRYQYAYPEMTEQKIKELREICPRTISCVHSRREPSCESCMMHQERSVMLFEASRVLEGS